MARVTGALLLAADAVDSTVGLQMAYLKSWAPRALKPLALRTPVLTPLAGRALRGEALDLVHRLPAVDLAYLDPPYNQHRYSANYHVWETLIRWDAPAHYGVACKRSDSRDPTTASAFNRRRTMPDALAGLIAAVDARIVAVSFSDDGYVPLPDLIDMCAARGHPVEVVSFEHPRHIGARIGIHNPAGVKVGTVGRTNTLEHLVLSGPGEVIREMAAAAAAPAAPREPAATRRPS